MTVCKKEVVAEMVEVLGSHPRCPPGGSESYEKAFLGHSEISMLINFILTDSKLSVRNLFGRGRGASVKKTNVKLKQKLWDNVYCESEKSVPT